MGEEIKELIIRSWKLVIRLIIAIVFLLVAVSFLAKVDLSWIGFWNLLKTIAFLLLAIVATGLTKIPYNENRVFDLFGVLVIKKPGLQFIFPVIHKYVETTPAEGMQDAIELFSGEDEYWIDAAIGGSLNFKKLKLYYEFKESGSIEEVFREVKNPIQRMLDEAENAVRFKINATPIADIVPDEAKDEKTAKRELEDFLFNAIEKSKGMKAFLEDIENQIELRSATFRDYNLHKDVMVKRKERYDSIVDVQIAEQKAEAKKREIGVAIGESAKTLVDDYRFGKEKAEDAAIVRHGEVIAAEKGNLQKIDFKGGGGIASIIAEMELTKRIMGRLAKKEEGEKGEAEEKKKPEDEDWVH